MDIISFFQFIYYLKKSYSVGQYNGHWRFVFSWNQDRRQCSFIINSFAVVPNLEHRAPFGVSVITHIQTHGRTPLDEWSARRRDLYLHRTTQHINTRDKDSCLQRDSNRDPSSQTAADLRPKPRVPGIGILHYCYVFIIIFLKHATYGYIYSSNVSLFPKLTKLNVQNRCCITDSQFASQEISPLYRTKRLMAWFITACRSLYPDPVEYSPQAVS
jgi:hypothetical protein